MKEVNAGALIRIKNARHLLTLQQYRTLRSQVLAGDPDGAMRGLRKLLLSQGTNAVKNKNECFTENVKQEKIVFHGKHHTEKERKQ